MNNLKNPCETNTILMLWYHRNISCQCKIWRNSKRTFLQKPLHLRIFSMLHVCQSLLGIPSSHCIFWLLVSLCRCQQSAQLQHKKCHWKNPGILKKYCSTYSEYCPLSSPVGIIFFGARYMSYIIRNSRYATVYKYYTIKASLQRPDWNQA